MGVPYMVITIFRKFSALEPRNRGTEGPTERGREKQRYRGANRGKERETEVQRGLQREGERHRGTEGPTERNQVLKSGFLLVSDVMAHWHSATGPGFKSLLSHQEDKQGLVLNTLLKGKKRTVFANYSDSITQ